MAEQNRDDHDDAQLLGPVARAAIQAAHVANAGLESARRISTAQFAGLDDLTAEEQAAVIDRAFGSCLLDDPAD